MRQSLDLLLSSGHGKPTVTMLHTPWKGFTYRCEGFDGETYANVMGHSQHEVEVRWRAKVSMLAAIETQQDAEAKIYKHNKKKWDK